MALLRGRLRCSSSLVLLFFFVGTVVFDVVGCISNGTWYNPVADPRAIVYAQNARFTVLTGSIIRIEYCINSTFEDRASLAILNRRLPVVPFSASNDSYCTQIKTENLNLIYCPKFNDQNGFTPLSLRIQSIDMSFTWTPGMINTGALHGTVRTLEGYFAAGPHELNCSKIKEYPFNLTYCTEGLISRSGWVLVNDSTRPVLDNSDWPWVLERYPYQVDWYFFGHGLNFKKALYEFTLIAGKIPLPPRYSFGIFWSRYWAFSDRGFQELVREYVNHNTPLDILVVDMDWHMTFYKEADAGVVDQAGQSIGWTGYTWDKHLFPNSTQFLDWVRNQGLHVTLNLHPASGIQPWEEKYPEMAVAMGIDPSTNLYVPLDFITSKYHTNLFNIVLDPLDIDFWWLDWQQYQNTSIPYLYPTFWLNYIFFTHFERNRETRPLILHRWGGLGNHRYQFGFSGDTYPSWEALNFQPYFTATAANVGFMWSHDLGGHMEPSPPEIYTRWVQFGAWSPVFRTHCTKSPDNDRRIWVYPFENFKIMRDTFELRSRMVPYIYTNARKAHDNGLALVHSLYYEWPEYDEAYAQNNQYLFGDDIMVVPITEPVDPVTQVAWKAMWIPPGSWIEWDSLSLFEGPLNINRSYTLAETPVFVKAGSIITMLPVDKPLLGSAQYEYFTLHLNVFLAGTSNSTVTTQLYEDNGNDNGNYETQFSWTQISLQELQDTVTLTVHPTQGSYVDMMDSRSYVVQFNGISPPSLVLVNGVTVPFVSISDVFGWTYDSSYFSVTVNLPDLYKKSDVLLVKVIKNSNSVLFDPKIRGVPRCFSRLESSMNILDNHFPNVYQEDYTAVADANELAETIGNQMNSINGFRDLVNRGISSVVNLSSSLPENVVKQVVTYLQNCYQ